METIREEFINNIKENYFQDHFCEDQTLKNYDKKKKETNNETKTLHVNELSKEILEFD